MKKRDLEIIQLVIIGAVTMFNVEQLIYYMDIGSITITVLSLLIGVLYLKDRYINPSLFYVWIVALIPAIATTSFVYSPNVGPINFTLGANGETFEFQLNVLPFFLFGLYRFASIRALVGQYFEVKELKKAEHSVLSNFLPLIEKAVDLEKNGNDKRSWLKFELKESVKYNDEEFTFLLVSPKDEAMYTSKKFVPSFIRVGNKNKISNIKAWAIVKKVPKPKNIA